MVKLRTSLGKGQLAFSRPLKTFSVRQLLSVLPFPICKMSSLSSLAGARLERKAEIGDKLFSFGVDLDLLSFLKWFAGLREEGRILTMKKRRQIGQPAIILSICIREWTAGKFGSTADVGVLSDSSPNKLTF